MPDFEIRHLVAAQADLGEAPSWSVEDQALYWCDIEGKKFHRYDPVTGKDVAFDAPGLPGCFNFREGGGAVVACNTGYFDFDFATKKFEKICDPPFSAEEWRFNDGKADRQGRFWSGSIKFAFKSDGPPEGTFYRYEKGKVVPALPDIYIPNGVAFSLDGKTMYRGEVTKEGSIVLRYDYDIETGTPSNPTTFFTMPKNYGVPDGAAVDTEGHYWHAAAYGDKGRVCRYKPDGTMDFSFEMPVLGPTMTAFGGKDMKTLFITSCRIERYMGLPLAPQSGDLFAVDTGFQGVPETLSARA